MPGWQLLGASLAVAGYALVSHLLMVHAAREPWAAVVLLGPMLLVAAAVALRQRHAGALLACAVAAAVLAMVTAAGGLHSVERLYVLQHAAFHAAFGVVFGATLRRGATPLITVLAARVQGRLPDGVLLYTRRVTGLWVAYFFGMVVLSLALFALAPWWWWSLYANVFTPLAALALFLGEFMLRYRLHPEFQRVTLAQTLHAYRATPLVAPPRELL